mmetsp:Transcript_8973/g.24448  ORF Transcript_8973/g.24448 Transcript_8973/m.24448 type:complete len:101 (+) Transcript_8973:462-764(+)
MCFIRVLHHPLKGMKIDYRTLFSTRVLPSSSLSLLSSVQQSYLIYVCLSFPSPFFYYLSLFSLYVSLFPLFQFCSSAFDMAAHTAHGYLDIRTTVFVYVL